MCNWLINIAHTNNNGEFKEKLLIETFKTLLPFTSVLNSTDYSDTITQTANTLEKIIPISKPPSLFVINILFMKNLKKKGIEINVETDDNFEQFGRAFGQK